MRRDPGRRARVERRACGGARSPGAGAVKVYAGMDPRLPLGEVGAYARRVEQIGYDGLQIAETIHDALAVVAAGRRAHRADHDPYQRGARVRAQPDAHRLRRLGSRPLLGRALRTRTRHADTTEHRRPLRDASGSTRCHACGSTCRRSGALFCLIPVRASAPRFDGDHYRITRMQPYFNPGPGSVSAIRPPLIYLGGVNAGICELAGEVADGFVTHPTNSSPRYLETLCRPALTAGAQRRRAIARRSRAGLRHPGDHRLDTRPAGHRTRTTAPAVRLPLLDTGLSPHASSSTAGRTSPGSCRR